MGYNSLEMSRAQQILFGSDPTERVVAVETGPNYARLYRRLGETVVVEDRPFRHWLLTTEKFPLPGAIWMQLEGEGFNWLAEFDDRGSFESARLWLRDAHAEHLVLPTSAKQFLVRSGITLFKGMSFDQIVRVQLDIETATLSPEHPRGEILLVAVADNRGFERIIEGDERRILRELVELIHQLDPDVIEGHNIHEFDLPYLSERARVHGMTLALGRDGSEVTFGSRQQCAIGYYTRPFVPANIYGRHVIDTMLLAQRFDVGKGLFASHSLKALAQTLGISEPDREIIPHEKIAQEYCSNPERVKKYAMQDVRETRSLAEIVSPSEFYLTQMIPDTYQHATSTGSGEKINLVMIREYLRNGRAIPKPDPPKSLPGGYTEVRTTGVIERVVKCDVESLYPSIMLTRHIKPEKDTLDVFLPALEELTRRRIEAKRKVRETTGRESSYWEGLQSAFKILINSFYGYLAGPFNFNDYEAARRITTTGRAIVKQIVEELERTGSQVIEVDTDGVYFKPPPEVDGEEAELEYVEKIGSILPQGIRLAHDGRYRAMISLKMKNYVLVDYGGNMTFKGSSLRSRADERFGQMFISKAAEYLLRGEKDKVRQLYDDLINKINSGELTIDMICRRERITEKTFSAVSKKRIAQVVSPSRIGDYVSVYNRSDGSVALASEYDHDEDREYLLDKLYKFACRLREAFGDEFDEIFEKPSSKLRTEAAGQQKLFE